MNQDVIWQLVRYALLLASGYVTSKGWASEDQISAILGAAGTLISVGWGVYVKWGTTSVPDSTAKRPDVPTVSPVTGTVKL